MHCVNEQRMRERCHGQRDSMLLQLYWWPASPSSASKRLLGLAYKLVFAMKAFDMYLTQCALSMSYPVAEDDLLRLRFLSKIEMVHVTWRVQ